MYLLTNNIPLKEREIMDKLYRNIKLDRRISTYTSFIATVITFSKYNFPMFTKGWKAFPFLLIWYSYNYCWNLYQAHYNAPMFMALIHKHLDKAKHDLYLIKDEKREWFDIDDSEYMAYSNKDVDEMNKKYGMDEPDYSAIPLHIL